MKLSSQEYSIFAVLLAWTLIWKGLALWRSARSNQLYWFLFFVAPINTVGILEITYLFFFAKKKIKIEEITEWLKKRFNKKSEK
jgi:hypothetical protein